MTSNKRFENVVIMGGGYCAHLAAIALDPFMKIKAMISPGINAPLASEPETVYGQIAHSHIFLPRLEKELDRLDPKLVKAFSDRGLKFVPGSTRLGADAPMESRRLFATRWQFDGVVRDVYHDRVDIPRQDASVTEVSCRDRFIRTICLADGNHIQVNEDTLVLDAMGTRSPVMGSLVADCDSVQDLPSGIAYVTRFFRLKEHSAQELPDPLIECSHDFGVAHVMLYPAQENWFTVTTAVNMQKRDTLQMLRQTDGFMAFCRKHPQLTKWLDAADPVGGCRVFINPRNRWNVAIFADAHPPLNYLAVGDALTSMIPTLGANCSFAATHIRIMRDLLRHRDPSKPFHQAFHDAVHQEQFGFFQDAARRRMTKTEYIAYEDAVGNRPSKRFKRRVRRILGLDRARIARQLAASSSL